VGREVKKVGKHWCKSTTFAYVRLRGNKSKLGLEEGWMIKLVKLWHCTAAEPTSNVAHNNDLK